MEFLKVGRVAASFGVRFDPPFPFASRGCVDVPHPESGVNLSRFRFEQEREGAVGNVNALHIGRQFAADKFLVLSVELEQRLAVADPVIARNFRLHPLRLIAWLVWPAVDL